MTCASDPTDNLNIGVHCGCAGLWAEVLDLTGCFASGENAGELAEALVEAVALYTA